MSDTTTVQSPSALARLVCVRCGTAAYVPSGTCGSLLAALEDAGWSGTDLDNLTCDFCLDREPWDGGAERQAFATALAAEDKAPKQTEQEAAQAYDAETLSRLEQLLIELSLAGRITAAAFDWGTSVLGTLKCAVNHPSMQGWGDNCTTRRGFATNEEAL